MRASEGPKQINCSSCNSEIDLTNTEWTIGWYKNMKTKMTKSIFKREVGR